MVVWYVNIYNNGIKIKVDVWGVNRYDKKRRNRVPLKENPSLWGRVIQKVILLKSFF